MVMPVNEKEFYIFFIGQLAIFQNANFFDLVRFLSKN